MSRRAFLPLGLIGLAAASALDPAASAAQPTQYRAELAAPAAAERMVVRETVWHCAGDACSGAGGSSRPAIVCAALARQAGALRGFSVDGRAIAPEELEKCNARAR